jgi:hypothetical protein
MPQEFVVTLMVIGAPAGRCHTAGYRADTDETGKSSPAQWPRSVLTWQGLRGIDACSSRRCQASVSDKNARCV